MRIAVMAAGAVGGYFGARLANAGHDVFFIARGAHLDAIRKDGLKIESTLGDLHLPKPNVTDDPKEVGPVDVVLFAVKLWDTAKSGEQALPLLGRNSRLITVQNGIDAVEILSPILGADRTVGGIARIATVIERPGVIKHTSRFAAIRYGRADRKSDAQLSAFADAAKKANLDIAISDDFQLELWAKFAFLVTMSAATASTRRPIGEVVGDDDSRNFFFKVMQEVIAVGKAKGVTLPDNLFDQGMALVQAAPKDMRASMAHDLERGNRLELDWLSGKVVALGRELGVPTPANEAVYAILKPHRMGRAA